MSNRCHKAILDVVFCAWIEKFNLYLSSTLKLPIVKVQMSVGKGGKGYVFIERFPTYITHSKYSKICHNMMFSDVTISVINYKKKSCDKR